MANYLYLSLLILTVLVPLIMSFEKKMYFFGKWKAAFSAIFISAIPFLIWDILFTNLGIWGFNESYNLGILIFGLPIEEILFFIIVPFSCLFIYETVFFLLKDKIWKGFFYQFSLVLMVVIFFVATTHIEQWYTLLASASAFLVLTYHCVRKKQMSHEVFWVSFLIILIPFTIVNGVLTGIATDQPVVWYNDNHNLGIRFFTIPLDDFIYNLALILLNVTIYERILGRLYQNKS